MSRSEALIIDGGRPLSGRVEVAGAKNAALPVMAACISVRGACELSRVPSLTDVDTMAALLRSLGAVVHCDSRRDGVVHINSDFVGNCTASFRWVSRMRAGICVLGPLLARFGQARVSLPGGCQIGHRPIDLHLRGLAALGASVHIENGDVVATARRLIGADVDLHGPHGSSVTATCNVMTAAATADGTTVIRGAAREPEVVDLGQFLIRCGARIDGLGTSVISVSGVSELRSCRHEIIPDRIEAATYLLALAITRGHGVVSGLCPEHLTAVLDLLRRIGVRLTTAGDSVAVDARGELRACEVTAGPYPEIPTDTQAQFTALLCTVSEGSLIRDTVFPERFAHVAELNRLGAGIERQEGVVLVPGGRQLTGAAVTASDLRASAALVLAGLAAGGRTVIHQIHHLDRGYSGLRHRLAELGARIHRSGDGTELAGDAA